MSDYELVTAKGRSFTAVSASDLLYNIGDFIFENEAELLSINTTYNQDEGDYTAYVLYE
jgi:hypothetical protein